MEKPSIFISHITEERDLANIIKNFIQKDFLGMINIFISSGNASISAGSKWLNEVDTALRTAEIELILCSEESIYRPWINFEAGAGWLKGIPIVPICHSDLQISALPIPLILLQAIELRSHDGLSRLYDLIAKKLSSAIPRTDFSEFIECIEDFEKSYKEITAIKRIEKNSKMDFSKEIQQNKEALLIIPKQYTDKHELLLNNSNTGIFRILPDRKGEYLYGISGGCSYYSFLRRQHDYGYGNEIELCDGKFKTGFAGADYGYIAALGDFPIENFLNIGSTPPSFIPSSKHEIWNFFWEYCPPKDMNDIRKEQNEAHTKVVGENKISNSSAAISNMTYLLRAIEIDDADLLIVFRTECIENSGSFIITWILLKTFDTPIAIRSEK